MLKLDIDMLQTELSSQKLDFSILLLMYVAIFIALGTLATSHQLERRCDISRCGWTATKGDVVLAEEAKVQPTTSPDVPVAQPE